MCPGFYVLTWVSQVKISGTVCTQQWRVHASFFDVGHKNCTFTLCEEQDQRGGPAVTLDDALLSFAWTLTSCLWHKQDFKLKVKSAEHFKTKCCKAFISSFFIRCWRKASLLGKNLLWEGWFLWWILKHCSQVICWLCTSQKISHSWSCTQYVCVALSTTLPRTVHVWNGPRNDD